MYLTLTPPFPVCFSIRAHRFPAAHYSGLIKRGVKNIISFVNCETPLAPGWDPTAQPRPTDADMDNVIPAFFGMADDNASIGIDYTRDVLFDASGFVPLVQQLQRSQAAGHSALALTNLTTVKNDWYGIDEGVHVQILWVYLARSFLWENALGDPEVRAQAVVNTTPWDPRPIPQSGNFTRFPYWNDVTDLHQSAAETNLLADYTAWVVHQNEALFRTIFNASD